MKLPLNWINEFLVSPNTSLNDLYNKLTMSGTKIENICDLNAQIKNVVVGKIIDITPHPDADKLIVCQLDVNQGSYIQIVTGAKNVSKGDLVPVALNKSLLPNGQKIKKGKLRGIESNGMLCSLSELNLTIEDFPYADIDGIFILKEPCNIGDEISKVIKTDDVIIDFEITTNRPDCLSVIGIAMEVCAVTNTELKLPIPTFNVSNDLKTLDMLTVDIEDSTKCKRYIAKYIDNIKIETSPLWLRSKLKKAGIRPINNIVDITNYVMLECGQPLHAFDYSKINGNKIVVKTANKNDEFIALNNEKYELTKDNLIVYSDNEPLAIAGIIGSKNSSITEQTKSIVIESACFDYKSIRNSSKNLLIRTDSSMRFEKNISSSNCEYAIKRVCELIDTLNYGTISNDQIDINFVDQKPIKLQLDYMWINNFLGTLIPYPEVIQILKKLNFKILDDNYIQIPEYRTDISNKYDIAEEIVRIYGYDKIPTTSLVGSSKAKLNDSQLFEDTLHQLCVSMGLNEIKTIPFSTEDDLIKANLSIDDLNYKIIHILNPLGKETSIMQPSTLPSMINTLATNYLNRNLDVMLYEIANEYLKIDKNNYQQDQYLTIGGYGKNIDFYYIKGIIEAILYHLNIKNWKIEKIKDILTLHPGRSAKITILGEEIAILGELHPEVLEKYNIATKSYIAKLNITNMYTNISNNIKFKPIPKFPASVRDLSLICEKSLEIIKIHDCIKQSMGKYLENIELIDIYQGNQIDNNYKSVCYSITLRSNDCTMTDEEINDLINNTLSNLKKINVEIRN